MTAAPSISERTRLGLSILIVAVGVGVLGDQMLRAWPWGVNVLLCTIAFVGGGAWLVRRHRLPTTPDAPWLALTALLCAVAFVRRDSAVLQLLDILALLSALSLLALSTQGFSLRNRGVTTYGLSALHGFATTCFGSLFLLGRDIRWREVPRPARLGRLRSVAIGVALAVPLLALFGALFASADSAFAAAASEVFRFDVGQVAAHAFSIGVGSALTGGLLWGTLLNRAPALTAGERTVAPGLSFTAAATTLGLLNFLFVVFLALQVGYLFGGAAYVDHTTGLTLAQYARRGFFEMATASALVLPIVLLADWATARETPAERTSFRALLTLTVLLVGVMLTSALQRMWLYVGAFGLTELRLYTTGFMVWLAGVFAWFAWTVLRGRRPGFAFGALLQGWVVLAGLHLLNPDAFIARENLGRAIAGRAIGEPGAESESRDTNMVFISAPPTRLEPDVRYLAWHLSADAVPQLLAAMPHLSVGNRGAVSAALLHRWADPQDSDWRSWNWSASRAKRLVSSRQAELSDMLPAGVEPKH